MGKKKLEVGGLRLGLTKNEVIKLIGLPTKTAKDKMYFDYQGYEKFSKKALEINSSLKPGAFFFHQILITTIFKDSILTEFSVDESEQ